MNPGSRKKLQCIHDPSLIGLFNYILLRKSKLIKLLHDIDETGTGPSMAPCCIFYFLEASPTRTQRVRTLFLSSLSRRELPPLPNLKFSIFANSSATRHKMTLITSTLGRPPGYSVDSQNLNARHVGDATKIFSVTEPRERKIEQPTI